MSDPTPDKARGFAGLKFTASPAEPVATPPRVAAPTRVEALNPASDISSPAPPPQPTAPWNIIVITAGVGILLAALFLGQGKKEDVPFAQSGLQAAAQQQSAQVTPVTPAPAYVAPAATREAPPAPAPPTFSSAEAQPPVEIKPPIGTNQTLSQGQITYCLAEKIRISTWQALVDQTSDNSVDSFNAAVNDYNSHCGSFQYRERDMNRAREAVAVGTSALQQEGRSRHFSHL